MQHFLVKKPLFSTHFSFISSICRLLSTSLPSAEAVTQNPPVKSEFAFEYLVKSCGLPVEKSIQASQKIPHLKSPAKADAVLQFLRESGLSDSDITRAVGPQPQILCANLEKIIKPRIREAQEIGFSPSQIAQLVSLTPRTFTSKSGGSLQRKIDFWTPFLGSLAGIIRALKRAPFLLNVSVEKVVEPNISFLEKHSGISPSQIRDMIMRDPSMVVYNPNKLKEAAQRAEELGSPRGSSLFVYALQMTFRNSRSNLDVKIKNLSNLGFSKTEIDSLIKTHPMFLTTSDERARNVIAFLTNEVGLDLPLIARQPNLITYSLERRSIPRHYVIKTLQAKGLIKKYRFSSIMTCSEKKFASKFVTPYKDIIPEVCEDFEAACAGKISLRGKL